MHSNALSEDEAQFSLVLGGPLYQLYLRCRLVKPPIDLVRRRIAAFVSIVWLPLAVLCAIQGNLVAGVPVPFENDLSTHVRFLLTLPILIGAEAMVHRRIQWIVRQFIDRGLVAPQDRFEFDRMIEASMKLRNSMTFELALLVLAFTVFHWLWRHFAALNVTTWYMDASTQSFTMAGYWYVFVSLPIFRFLLLRWYFRLFVWYRFLWQVSRSPLQLNALHPDRSGGLGFMSVMPQALLPILLAQAVMLSGTIGDAIWHTGVKLPEFQWTIVAFLLFMLLLAYVPLTFFVPALHRARAAGILECGAFASEYVREFREKWIKDAAVQETPLGSGDIQSLADIGNSYQVVREMNLLPITKRSVTQFVGFIVLPLLPLLLTMVSLKQIVAQLIKMLL